MKKTYSKPQTQVIDLEANRILCNSDPIPTEWGGGFSQVPGLGIPKDNQLA